MDERERHALGMQNRRAVLGDAHVDRAIAGTTALNSEFQDLITRYAWGEIWSRPEIDHETRRLLTMSMLIALNREHEFVMHVRAALQHGVSVARIKEVILQSAIYCGVPAANSAFQATAAIVTELGLD
ncbi:4-carboxymuconolactone decarboxylase [Roseiterribacter gracilis]|uniref:4-carboxymuconolactone decarboxylase n=1 Tax=Roseiterribacter gracilis TaxID=2812848 RepID=A0A8S8XKG0_9PROT|nr:4-carboxymuconolactone decarboxylase [Rhodospirillales bacterium TMPK1]